MNRIDGTKAKMREFVAASIFTGIIFLLAFTPFGFINLVVIKGTVIHIPVIVGSITLGPYWGAFLGAMFGVTSLIINSTAPSLLSFAFSPLISPPGASHGSLWALVVCFVPRILVGVTPWCAYRLLQKVSLFKEKRLVSLFVSGIVGSATNTLLVMHIIYFVFKDSYALARNVASEAVYALVKGVIIANGIPEALLAGVLTSFICKAIETYRKGRN
ncbi:MAG: ECF transporter S component [Synergistaceae bacterium]|jgi:uncharacterized membrane protein|nr:ECF transporter S component [Synergistaceae bacterium]